MADEKYILAGWLIDGSGAEVKKRVAITIAEQKITAIESIDKVEAIDPALITDLSHCTVLPPLVDCNVDLCHSATVDPLSRQEQQLAGHDESSLLMSQHIHFCHSHGVLGVGHCSDGKDCEQHSKMKNRISDDAEIIIKSSAKLCRNESGVDSGDRVFSLSPYFNDDIDSYDYIKIISSEEVSGNTSSSTFSCYYSGRELDEIVKLAAVKGKKVIVLANGEHAVKMAIQSGCHAIEQGARMGEANMRDMVRSGIFWIPNIQSLESCMEGENNVARDVINRRIKEQIEQLSLSGVLGVKVALGSGAGAAGIIHGESAVGEIRYLLKAGYSLVEAIRCATLNSAELLGITEMGLLKKGRPANFLVSRGTPAQLPRKLSYLEAIYRNGHPSEAYRKNPIKTVISE